MPRTLIGDGYDFHGTTKATTFTGEVKFKFRPPVYRDIKAFDRSQLGSPEENANGMAEFLAIHIGEWNLEDKDDRPLEIKKETFLKIRDWMLLRQLSEMICESKLITDSDQKK